MASSKILCRAGLAFIEVDADNQHYSEVAKYDDVIREGEMQFCHKHLPGIARGTAARWPRTPEGSFDDINFVAVQGEIFTL